MARAVITGGLERLRRSTEARHCTSTVDEESAWSFRRALGSGCFNLRCWSYYYSWGPPILSVVTGLIWSRSGSLSYGGVNRRPPPWGSGSLLSMRCISYRRRWTFQRNCYCHGYRNACCTHACRASLDGGYGAYRCYIRADASRSLSGAYSARPNSVRLRGYYSWLFPCQPHCSHRYSYFSLFRPYRYSLSC